MKMNEPPAGCRAGVSPTAGAAPTELARRVLRLLSERRIVPTPESFADAYEEVAGRGASRGGSATVVLREAMRDIVRDVLRDLVRTQRLPAAEAKTILQLLPGGDWMVLRDALERALARRAGAAASGWPQMTVALLKQADALHTGWTRARKLEAVMRVMDGAREQPEVALERLSKLVESWGPAMAGLPREEAPAPPPAPPPAAAAQPISQRYAAPAETTRLTARVEVLGEAAEAWKQVALRAVRLLEQSCGSGSAAGAKLREYAAHCATAPLDDTDKIVARFTDAVGAIDRRIEEQHKIRDGLARLLALLTRNVNTLAPEENWLAGQLEPIRALLGGPLDAQQIAAAEQTVRGVIDRQSGARKGIQDAKIALKELLATLVEKIGTMGDSTGRFYEKLGEHQRDLAQADDLETLSRVMRGLLADTQTVRVDVQRSRDDLAAARREVETYEQRVRQLETELAEVASLVQKDPLTHALNRRGFEEAFTLETARAARYGTPLSLALLDLDNFKQLNDTFGHATGDRALVHLAQSLHALLRPTDLIARIGGEEFAVLLPAATMNDAASTIERIQNELRDRPLESEGSHGTRITLEFSAGISTWRAGETLEALLVRADTAMYAAKRAGKNCVVRDL